MSLEFIIISDFMLRRSIPFLVSNFLEKFNIRSKRKVKSVSNEVIELLVKYDWPGNVRELENVIENAFVLGSTPIITIDDLPISFRKLHLEKKDENVLLQSLTNNLNNLPSFDEFEIMLVKQALKMTNGNRSEAAKV